MPGLQDVVFGGVLPPQEVLVEISLDGGGSQTPDLDQIIQEVAGILSGQTVLIQGQDYVDVVFGSEQPTLNWVFLSATIFNTTDASPLNVWPGVLTSKTTAGFRLQLNGVPDTGNYYLYWSIKGVFGYYLSGPSSGDINVPSSNFTVRLPDGSTMTGAVIITPHGGVGLFTPSTVTLSEANPIATFTYTPTTYGSRSISTTNNRGMDNPPQIEFTPTTDTYTLSGPASGSVGTPSTDFTVALPAGAAVFGSVTITPDDGGAGGTFTPVTVDLSTGAPSATFTYTAVSSGDKTISVTNDGGLTNPGSLTYTALSGLFNNLISYWTLDEASGTRVDSHGSNDLSDNNTVGSAAGIINNGADFVAANSEYLSHVSNASLQMSGNTDFTITAWVNMSTLPPPGGAFSFVTKDDDAASSRDYTLACIRGSGWCFFIKGGGTYIASEGAPAASTGAWHFLVAWYDSSNGQVHLRVDDTTTFDSVAGATGTDVSAAEFRIGASEYSGFEYYADAVIDEVGIWKRKLTSQEITDLYNSGAGLPYSSF